MNVSIIAPKLIDEPKYWKTKNILYGDTLTPNNYVGNIITTVIKAYSIDDINVDPSEHNEWTDFYNKLYKTYPSYNYNELVNILKKSLSDTPTIDYVIASVMSAYSSHNLELLIRTHNTFGRPRYLEKEMSWLDNWTLNAPGNALNFVFYKNYDNDDIITINDECNIENDILTKNYKNGDLEKNIDEKIKSVDYVEDFIKNSIIAKKIIGVFRCFLILNNLLPKKIEKDINTVDDLINVAICYFPVYYLGAIACDWFNDVIAPTIKTIDDFLHIAPNVFVVAIVNASPSYAGDGGSHWMCLYFSNVNNKKKCSLLCPQGRSWDVFKDNNNLKNTILNNGFSITNNGICYQKDNCNCGLYSLLFIYEIIKENGNIEVALNNVGVDANNIKNINQDNTNNSRTIFRIKKTIFGYLS